MRTKTKNNPKTEKGYLKSIAWIPSSFLAGLSLCSLLCLAIIALHALPTASAESASSLVSLGVSPALSLSLTPENALSIPINPAGSGAYSSRKLTATVSTNNATGYTMTFSSGAGGTSLINSAAASNNDISPTSAAIASPNN